MSITIQSPEGRPLTTVSLNRGAKAAFSLMEHEYIELPFKLTEPVNIPVGSYVETAGHFDEATAALLRPRYYVCKPQSPTWNERTGAFEYRLRLDAPHYLWNNFIFRYTPENTGAEVSWTLTAPLDVQLGVFLRNLAALGFTHAGKPYTYVIHDTVENKAVAMTYDGTHLLDALYGMGDKEHWGCDVWVVDNAIHFGRCESGDPVRIELDAEARTMARSESKTDYATRLLVFGGTKNLPENYRAASPALTVNGVVQRRLMLPSGTPYVDVHPGRSVFGTVEQIVTFDDIYPRRTGTLSGVRTVDRTVKEGDKQTGTFKAYQYRDAGLTFKNDYVLKGQELRVVFQSGKLNGLHFAVQFNPEGKSPADQLWEIVANSDYGRLLPDETVRPADGDKYVLYGFDIRLVSDQYVPSAEQELKRRAEEYARRLAADDGTYTATLRGSWVDADPMRRTFAAGQRVRLVNPAFFPSDGRESRVIGWELNLDIPTDTPVYTFGESARYSRLADIEEKVDALVYKGTTYTGGGGSGVYVVRTNDSTPPSDSNVLSALRALATFIRKDRPDTMPHLLKLLDGLETGTFAAGRTGGRIDKQGNGELGSLTLRDLLTAVRLIADGVRSKNYTPGDMGTGFGLTTGEGGSLLEVDYLLVRRVATFLELLIREMRHVGGTLVLSGASGKVVRVEDKPAAWRVHFKTREDGTTVAHGFTVGAQARCQTYNRTSGNTYYWRLVTATGDDWVELSKSDYDKAAPTGTARTAPAVGDELVQLGHRTDSRQTGAIVLDTVGEGAPSIRLLKDIRSYSLTDANVRVLLSPSAVRVIADEVSFASGKTVEQTIKDSKENAIEAAKDYFDGQKKGIDDRIGEVSGKVDNLVIGGRNLLINTQFTKRDSYQTVRGTYRIELDSVERYQGSNSLKLTNTKAGKIYEDVLVSGEQPAAGEYITVSLYAKAATAGTILSVRVCDNGEVQQTAALTTAWQRISFTFHALKTPSRAIGIWYDRADTVWVALPKMEVGNKVTDWSPAPEDVASDAVAKANQALADAKEYTNTTKSALDSSISAAQTAAQTAQKNLDNLTIGGRNLLKYARLISIPATYAYGRGSYTTAVDTATLCEGQRSLKVTASKVGSVGGTDNFVWEAWNVVRQSECVTVSFYAKAATAGTRFSVRMGGDVCNFPQTVSLSTDWQRFEMTFREPGRKWMCIVAWFDRPGTVWIALPKMEYGTKPTDWTPAPEDVDNSIDGVRTAANQASADAGDAKRKAGEAATSAGRAESSAKNAEDSANAAKGKATEAAGSAKTASDKATNAANSASAAAGSAQTAATNAAQAKADADAAARSANASKEAADAAKTRLDSWAADNVISPMEKQGLRDETARIDADKSQVAAGYAKYGLGSYQSFTDAYNAYRAVLVTLSAKQPETISIPADFATKQRNYYTQRSTALTRIADAAKEYVDGLQVGGRNYFGQHKGVATNPAGALSPDNNGVVFRNRDRLNCRIEKLNLPGVGWYAVSMFIRATKACTIASINLCDAVSKDKTLENVSVTTSFRYITGVFHAERYINDNRWNGFLDFESSIDPSIEVTVRDLMITPGNQPMSWQPAPEDWVTKINDAKSAGTAAADALEAYKETVSVTFHDGIIQEAEALAIEKYRNIVNSEFGALTNTYNAINGNAYLEGTAKSALANAFNALRAAKDALITSVNNAISDKRVTEDEKQAVDAKYNAYQSAYAAYSAALEVANGSIHAKLKGLADKAANDIQVGGRNLIPDSDNGLLKHFIIHQPNNAPRYSTVDGWWRMAFDRDKQIVSRELTMSSVGTVQGLRKGNLAFSILCRTDGRIVPENLRISFFGGGVHRYVPANIENCGNNTYRIWGVYMNYPASDLRVPDFMSFSTADATYVEFRYPKLEYGTKPTDWSPAPEDITSEIAAKTEAARQAAQSEAIGLNKWIAQAYYTGENKAATPPKLEDIAGKTPTRTVELKDAQFNLSGNGSVFNMDNYTGIRTTYVYLDADYNLTTGIQHDGAGSLYVNGALVASGPLQTASWKSVTLPLKKGWNRIDGLWNEGGGGDFFKFQAPLENDAHIIQLACRPNVSIDPMRAVTMERVAAQESGFNAFNEQFTVWSKSTEKTLTEYNNELTKLTTRVTEAELKLTHENIWLGISEKVASTVDDGRQTIVNDLKSKTGIDIQQGVITLDAQKVKIQNGSETMAMFEGGKLKAELIDAKRIKANDILSQNIVVGNNATITNLRAKNAVIEGTVKARSTYMPFVDVSAASIGQNGLLDPFKYGCNIILTNGIGTGVDTVRLPMTADYSGVRLAIFCPIITRSGTSTVLRGKFTPFDQGIELATLFAPYGNAMVELIAVPMAGSTPIVWIPLGGGIPVKE